MLSFIEFLLKHCIIFCLVLFFSNCNKKTIQKNEYAQLLNEHPATNSKNYPRQSGDWTSRAVNIDSTRISFTKSVNEIDGFTEIPIESTSMEGMRTKLEAISKSFHPKVKDLFDKYLFAIYFCEKLGGTGISGFIYDNQKNKPVGGFIIIDSSVINKKANDWITYKERSAFQLGDISLQIQIENETDNTIDNALRYILLHEMGHIISNTLGISPDLRMATPDYKEYPFFNEIWISEKESNYDTKTFPFRSKVKFYSSDSSALKLDLVWDQVYPILNKTRFTTLYAATNALDDFAEAFVSYIHCILDNRPWELTLSKQGKVIYKMKNRIHELEREQEFLRRNVFK